MGIGCAGGGAPVGGGGGNNGGGGNGGGTGRVAANPVGLDDKPGYFDLYLLPGQGRAAGDMWANLHIFRLLQFGTNISAELDLPTDMKIQLNRFSIQNRGFNSEPSNAFGPYPNSKTYDTFDFGFGDNQPGGSIQGIEVEDDLGNINQVTVSPAQETMINEFEASAFRGRTSAFQLYINDSMIVFDTPNTAHLDVPAFLAANRSPETGKVRSFLADHLRFDISAIPQAKRPTMPAPLQFPPEESTARSVFFSGDCYAIGDLNPRGVNGSNGLFVFLPPGVNFFEGFYRPQDPTTLVKTYELKQADPSVIGQIRLISALKGTYKDFHEGLTNLHSTEFILLPKTGDGPKQDCVVLSLNGQSIQDMWFGTVDYSGSGSPTFRIYPIKNLYPASTVGEIRGTLPVNNLEGRGGATVSNSGVSSKWWQDVRYGQYKFNTSAPAGLTQTGDFVVYRAP